VSLVTLLSQEAAFGEETNSSHPPASALCTSRSLWILALPESRDGAQRSSFYIRSGNSTEINSSSDVYTTRGSQRCLQEWENRRRSVWTRACVQTCWLTFYTIRIFFTTNYAWISERTLSVVLNSNHWNSSLFSLSLSWPDSPSGPGPLLWCSPTTLRHITRQDSGRVIGPSQRPLTCTTQHTADIHAAGGIRTRNPSKRAATGIGERSPKQHKCVFVFLIVSVSRCV
jgi:hypothetical protein